MTLTVALEPQHVSNMKIVSINKATSKQSFVVNEKMLKRVLLHYSG